MAFERKQRGEASTAKRPSVLRLFLPGAALGLLLFVTQGAAFDDGFSPWSTGTVMASRLFADAVIGIVGLCAAYIAFYAVRWILARIWSWTRVTVMRRGTRP